MHDVPSHSRATDFGESAQSALAVAVALAEKLGADLTLLHAVWIPPILYPYADGLYLPIDAWNAAAKSALDEAVADLKKRHPRSEGVLATFEPAQAILETVKARHADLIVMGTHGRRGLSRVLLGSVAEKTVRLSPVPVLTVPVTAEEAETTSAKHTLAEEVRR